MGEVDKLAFSFEYLHSQFTLLGDEGDGLDYWLFLMQESQDAWQFDTSRQLLRFIKGIILSPQSKGHVHHATADLFRQQGDWDTAEREYDRALSIFRKLDRIDETAGVLNDYALLLQEQRRYQEAQDQYQQAADLYRSLDNTQGLGQVLSNIGSIAYEQGNWHEAVKYFQQSVSWLAKANARNTSSKAFLG